MSENIVPFHATPGVSGLGTPQAADAAQQVAGSGGGPHDPGMQARVTAIGAVLARLEPPLVRLDGRTNHLATKEDVALVRADLALKAGRGTVWGMGQRWLP